MNIQEITNRYIDNATAILWEKASKEDGFYQDKKYVQMAGNTLWNGVLEALNYRFAQIKKGKGPPDIDKFIEAVAKENRKMLSHLTSGYNYMHLLMGYDGDLDFQTSRNAIEKAKTIIKWAVGE